MLKTVMTWFKALSTVGKIGVITASVFGVGLTSAAVNPEKPITTPPESPKLTQQTHKTVTVTESVPFETSNIDDATLAKGVSNTITQGVDGVRTHAFDVVYENGNEKSRTEISNTITKQPVNRVVAQGTYVAPVQLNCPNGTYINSVGNTVCSPYTSNNAPAGATAQCTDGTYSFSQSRSGTCSHHGGVATWL